MSAAARSAPSSTPIFATISTRDHRRPLRRPVVFYCLADCWMSWNATKRAARWGYTQLYWYRDGTDGWEAAALPTEEATPAAGGP